MNSQALIKSLLIDPGHVGAPFFDFRQFKMDEIEFHEGDFSFAWAEALKAALVEKISKVVLTRPKRQPSVMIGAKERLSRKEELVATIGAEAALKKFRVPRAFFPSSSVDELLEAAIQNEGDLLKRSQTGNAEKYDLCLSLHLNGDPTSLKTEKNGICGFTNDASSSQYPLFQKIIKNISTLTSLPILNQVEDLAEAATGVFTDESLTLLKNIKIPTLLIEGPFQNNQAELKLLNQALLTWQTKTQVTGRLSQLTMAIVEAL